MKNLLSLITIALICCTSNLFAQVRLNGDIKAIGNSSLIIQYYEGSVKKDTTLKITNGKFIWAAPVTESQKITIIFPGRAIYIFVDPGEMSIKGTRDSVDHLLVSGSKTNDEAVAYAQKIKPLVEEDKLLSAQYGKVSGDEELKREERSIAIANQKRAMANNYVSSHRESAFSLNLVTESCRLGSYESVLKMYDLLDTKIKSTPEGKRIAERLAVLKHSAIGEKVKDFTLNDQDGKPVTIAAFKGKYVLIDFWASWCYPCREEIPNLIRNYNAYKDQNFTILSISLDEHQDKWLNAVAAHKMAWTQLIDLKAWEGELVTHYGIKGIPSTLLIDPNGNIIAKDLRGIALSNKLKELFKKSSNG